MAYSRSVSVVPLPHLSDEELGLYVQARASPDLSFATHLATCELCKERLLETEIFVAQGTDPSARQGRAFVDGDRRRHPRIALHEHGSLTRLNPLLAGRWPIHVLNVSMGGLKLHVPEALEPGTIVQIRFRGTILVSEVRYCRPVGSEFQVGVCIQDVFPLGKGRASPKS